MVKGIRRLPSEQDGRGSSPLGTFNGRVVQMDRTLRRERKGRVFESPRVHLSRRRAEGLNARPSMDTSHTDDDR